MGVKKEGYNELTWDSKNNSNETFSSGVYFYSIVGEDFHSTKKLVLLKWKLLVDNWSCYEK